MSEQPGSGAGASGPHDSQPPGYLVPPDHDNGVSAPQPPPLPSQEPPAAPPPLPPAAPPTPPQPAFTLPSAEPDSPVSSPGAPPQSAQPSQNQGGASAGYGLGQPGQGSYAAPDQQYGPPSSPPAYSQSAPPAYNVPSGPPAYQPPASPPPPQYGQQPSAGYQPPYSPGGYGTPQYGVTLPQSSPPRNGMAVGAMITGIGSCVVSLVGCCGLGTLGVLGVFGMLAGGAGLALGLVARKQIREAAMALTQTGVSQYGGVNLALTGIITGACGAFVGIIDLILWVVRLASS